MQLDGGLFAVRAIAQIKADTAASESDMAGAVLNQLCHQMAVEAAAGTGLSQPRHLEHDGIEQDIDHEDHGAKVALDLADKAVRRFIANVDQPGAQSLDLHSHAAAVCHHAFAQQSAHQVVIEKLVGQEALYFGKSVMNQAVPGAGRVRA